MSGPILWAVVALALGTPFVLIWWKVADRWADEEHKRFKPKQGKDEAAPTVVRRSDVESHGGK